MRTADTIESTRADARGDARPFDARLSLAIDAIVLELEQDDPAPNSLRRTWLRLVKRWHERSIEAYQPASRGVMIDLEPPSTLVELLEEVAA